MATEFIMDDSTQDTNYSSHSKTSELATADKTPSYKTVVKGQEKKPGQKKRLFQQASLAKEQQVQIRKHHLTINHIMTGKMLLQR